VVEMLYCFIDILRRIFEFILIISYLKVLSYCRYAVEASNL
jgi:hypothetical protein